MSNDTNVPFDTLAKRLAKGLFEKFFSLLGVKIEHFDLIIALDDSLQYRPILAYNLDDPAACISLMVCLANCAYVQLALEIRSPYRFYIIGTYGSQVGGGFRTEDVKKLERECEVRDALSQSIEAGLPFISSCLPGIVSALDSARAYVRHREEILNRLPRSVPDDDTGGDDLTESGAPEEDTEVVRVEEVPLEVSRTLVSADVIKGPALLLRALEAIDEYAKGKAERVEANEKEFSPSAVFAREFGGKPQNWLGLVRHFDAQSRRWLERKRINAIACLTSTGEAEMARLQGALSEKAA